jgi:hypothetical protein
MTASNSPTDSIAEYPVRDENDLTAFRKINRFCLLLEVLLIDKVPCLRCDKSNFYLVERSTDSKLVWYCRACFPPQRRESVLGTYRRKILRVRADLIDRAASRSSAASGWDEWGPSRSFEMQLAHKLALLTNRA